MYISKLAAIVALAAAAAASPIASAAKVTSADAVVKRATEGIHLVNCLKNNKNIYSAVVVSSPNSSSETLNGQD